AVVTVVEAEEGLMVAEMGSPVTSNGEDVDHQPSITCDLCGPRVGSSSSTCWTTGIVHWSARRWCMCCWIRFNGRMDDIGKDVVDALAAIDAWIDPISFSHKNRAKMMLPSGSEMGANRG
ncbi:hypothetical protein ACLOJK_039219, partial [Asimina triloba]